MRIVLTARRALLLGFIGAGALVAACVGDSPSAVSIVEEGGADGGGGTGPGTGADGGVLPQGDGGGPGACAVACADPTTLTQCLPDGAAQPVQCAFDCSTDGGAHCGVFVPSPPVTAQDTALTGLQDITLAADGFINSDDGTFDGVRAANPAPATADAQGGVRFHVRNGVGIFSMKSLTIPAGVTLKARGAVSIAIVADSIAIHGVLDVRGYGSTGVLCQNNVAGPGGFAGGNGTAAGLGPGGGAPGPNVITGAADAGGGGGGGYGGDGGNGGLGANSTNVWARGGPAYPLQVPVVGGSGGGSAAFGGYKGGGGGGAVQLVGLTQVSIGDAAGNGGINAGGCGGTVGSMGSSGGGGGSGGTIYIESPNVSLHDQAVLASNGGAGASGNGGGQAPSGAFGATTAFGTSGTGGYGYGGAGGSSAIASPAGIAGQNGGNGSGGAGGAGGGASGRIQLLNATGVLAPSVGVVLSPGLGSGATVVAKIGVQ